MAGVVSADGTRIHSEETGSGRPLVLVHGWCGSSRIWDPVVPALAQKRRVVRMDLRGCGDSYGAEDTHDFDHYAADLDAVMEAHDVQDACLVGWSMGAGVVYRYLQTRAAPRVTSVALIDYPPRLAEARDVAEKVCHQLNKRRDVFVEGFVAKMFRDPKPEAQELLQREFLRVTRRQACSMYRAMGLAPQPEEEETFEVPALLIFPTGGWFPEALADWRVRFPEHEAPPFEASAHAPVLEEPEAFVQALLDFTDPAGVRATGPRV